ncbi:MAG: hypothetical protein Q4Q07_09775 [Tissierellia bacterium]|nr:hypothetical protein [Tissierellia bacterium]
MLIQELGMNNKKKALFFPGGFTDFNWYKPIMELLSERWHTFGVMYDGYYEPFEHSFTSVEDIAHNVLDYFKQKEIVDFDLVYGFCMGGSMANLVYASNQLHIKTLIIDAGISPYELPHFLTRLILLRDVLGIKIVRSSKKLLKMVYSPDRWLYPWEEEEEAYDEIQNFMKKLSNETIRNGFDSTNNYKMPKTLPHNNTKMYYLYGDLEKKERAWDIDYFRKTYPQMSFKEMENREHGELVTIGYQECIKVIDEIVNQSMIMDSRRNINHNK